jgi:hypothetical protein
MWKSIVCLGIIVGAEYQESSGDNISSLIEDISLNLQKEPLEGGQSVFLGYESLFKDANSEKISNLIKNTNISISLQAMWRMREYKSNKIFDPTSFYYLPHFIETEYSIPVPPEWSVEMVDLYIDSKEEMSHALTYYHKKGARNIYKEDHANNQTENFYVDCMGLKRHKTDFGMEVPLDTKISINDNKLNIQQNNLSLRIDRKLMPTIDKGAFNINCTSSLKPDKSFIAFHIELGYSYPLYCIDSSTGDVIWKTIVWANSPAFRSVGLSGPPRHHDIYFSITDKYVVVFGAGVPLYVEAFDIKNGKNIFRFSIYFISNEGDNNKDAPFVLNPLIH